MTECTRSFITGSLTTIKEPDENIKRGANPRICVPSYFYRVFALFRLSGGIYAFSTDQKVSSEVWITVSPSKPR